MCLLICFTAATLDSIAGELCHHRGWLPTWLRKSSDSEKRIYMFTVSDSVCLLFSIHHLIVKYSYTSEDAFMRSRKHSKQMIALDLMDEVLVIS